TMAVPFADARIGDFRTSAGGDSLPARLRRRYAVGEKDKECGLDVLGRGGLVAGEAEMVSLARSQY
ncbi:hypothetical protein KCV04_g1067, partial [Aureobasidium melanogenum]